MRTVFFLLDKFELKFNSTNQNILFINSTFNKGVVIFENLIKENNKKTNSTISIHIENSFFSNKYISFKNLTLKGLSIIDNNFSNTDLIIESSSVDFLTLNKNFFQGLVSIKNITSVNIFVEDSFISNGLFLSYGNKNTSTDKLSFRNTINNGTIVLNWEDDNIYDLLKNKYNIKSNFPIELSNELLILWENAKKNSTFEIQDSIHIKYMNCLTNKTFFQKFLGLTSNYGTSPRKILLWSLILIILFAIPYWLFSKEIFPQSQSIIESVITAIYFSGITFLTIGYGDITPSGNLVVMVLTVLEGIIGIVFMSVLTLTIVRKVIR